ncbi:MAG: putative DNA binding domain-containing protein [Candidatus Methanoplasma sp.]|jgi:hypothetical protein|nr:putative DNA binding domain-containing protein [Candidatus Methanoplasma sp.]
MPGDTEDRTPVRGRAEKYVSGVLYASYAVMLVLSVVSLVVGIILGNFPEVITAIPVIIILAGTLLTDRTLVHIPPFMVFVMVGIMMLITFWRSISDNYWMGLLADCLFGVVMGIGGLVITYSLMNVLPGTEVDKTQKTARRAAFVTICVALSMFTLVLMAQYYLGLMLNMEPRDVNAVMRQLALVLIGAVSVSILFYFGKKRPALNNTVTRFLEKNIATLDIEEYEMMEIEKALRSGESEKVEYKSTLRTNLATGEKDTRMEKAVLKTLVAFLNSNGGTLLIGISDDGTAVGIDEASFDSRDKLNLHLTNLIASQIGNEFLPYISFRLSDYDGKGVMRIVCRKSDGPVFLKEGKQETFYVRSGPSSVDLHGMDTLNYVDNRFKNRRKNRTVRI